MNERSDQNHSWVLVANAAQARFYSRQKRFSPLVEVGKLEEANARQREQDLVSDAPGRSFDSRGAGRHAMEPGQSRKGELRRSFARRIAEALDRAASKRRYRHLILVAAPAMLGELRSELSNQVRERVTAEHHKDMTDQDAATIARLVDG